MNRYRPYLPLLKPVRGAFALGVLAGILYAFASALGLPLISKAVLPVIFNEPGQESNWLVQAITSTAGEMPRQKLILITCLWLPLIFLIRAVGKYFNGYLINYCGLKVLEQLRIRLFSHLQALPLSFFHKNKAGDLLARQTADTEVMRQILARVSNDLITQPAMLIAAMIFLISEATKNDGLFAILISLGSIPLCIIPIRLASKKLKKRAKRAQNETGNISALTSENLHSPLEIRSYNLQDSFINRFITRTNNFLKQSLKVTKYRLLISPAIEVIAAIGFSAALYLSAGTMSLSSFTAIGMALYMSYEPIKKLGNISALLRQGEASVDRFEAILNAKNDLPEPTSPQKPATQTGKIEFKNVTFHYDDQPNEIVLNNLTTTIQSKECVALIGASGAGKTTFANLIPRFYDVTNGSIEIDGLDVRQWSKNDLRQNIAIVSQTPTLFSGTIADNIRLGKPSATAEEITAAAQKAYAHDFITQFPNGYESTVAESGSSLSGGQRQRIALARAFLKDAPILILDEATSALDKDSEAKVQAALTELIKDRTTLIIAHRLSTTKIANRTLMFDRGNITTS